MKIWTKKSYIRRCWLQDKNILFCILLQIWTISLSFSAGLFFFSFQSFDWKWYISRGSHEVICCFPGSMGSPYHWSLSSAVSCILMLRSLRQGTKQVFGISSDSAPLGTWRTGNDNLSISTCQKLRDLWQPFPKSWIWWIALCSPGGYLWVI